MRAESCSYCHTVTGPAGVCTLRRSVRMPQERSLLTQPNCIRSNSSGVRPCGSLGPNKCASFAQSSGSRAYLSRKNSARVSPAAAAVRGSTSPSRRSAQLRSSTGVPRSCRTTAPCDRLCTKASYFGPFIFLPPVPAGTPATPARAARAAAGQSAQKSRPLCCWAQSQSPRCPAGARRCRQAMRRPAP